MGIFTVEKLDTWLRAYEGTTRGGEPYVRTVPEFPIAVYLRWLKTTEDDDTFRIKLDLAVTEMGREISDRNVGAARNWIEENFSEYPDGLNNSMVRDLQQLCDYVRAGNAGPLTIQIDGGTTTVENEEQIEADGEMRTMLTATITTSDVLTLTVQDAIRASIYTSNL